MKKKERLRDNYIFAMYKGDEFICVGNKAEIAEMTGYTKEQLHRLSKPSYIAFNPNGTILIRVEDDDDDKN